MGVRLAVGGRSRVAGLHHRLGGRAKVRGRGREGGRSGSKVSGRG